MNYIDYKKDLKYLEISSLKFSKIVGISDSTPSSAWRRKNEVPKMARVVLELLKELPIEKRLMFIHNKLEEREKENAEK